MWTRRLTQTCIDLIDIESVSGHEEGVEVYIRDAVPSSFEFIYDKDSVLFAVSPRRPAKPLLVLAGHTDTVPVEGNLPARVEGDVIFGRGSSDMKAGLAVMLELARWIHDEEIELAFDLGLLFFGREELAGNECPLLHALDDSAFAGIDLAILMEPTANAIEAGCMGNLNLRVTFAGKSAHSARPWQGENAIHKAIGALGDFAQRPPEPVAIDGLEFTEVASITRMNAGTAMNVVPASADFFINIRYAPNRDPQETETMWRKYFENMRAGVEVIGNSRSAPVMLKDPLVQQLQNSGVASIWAKQAWTNVADFAEHGITAVNFGPGNPLHAHKQDEQVPASALIESLDILQHYVTARSR